MSGIVANGVGVARSGLSRRSLFRAAGAGAMGVAFAPWLDNLAAAQESTPVAAPSENAWRDLAARLSGWLLRPGDAMYPPATVINATRYMDQLPAGIAVCVSTEDVAACVSWVRETGIPFAVRSGGHNYAGFSNSSGLIIDVKGMRSVSIDPATNTLTAAGGVNNADIANAIGPYGVYFPGGRCPTVGVAGLTLGGGWGFSCRHLGMTCDNLVSTQLVTAAGDIVTASDHENPDLFWAVRGAAGGNFGVHTEFTYRLVPTGTVTVFSMSWSGGDTAALIDGLCRMQVDGPRELGMRFNIHPQSRLPATDPSPFTVDLIGLFWGTEKDFKELLEPVEKVQEPAERTVEETSFAEALQFLAATTPIGTYAIKTGFVRGTLPAAGISTLLEWAGNVPGVPSGIQDGTVGFYGFGGKVKDLPPDANAFVHRDADLMFKIEINWDPLDAPELIAANMEWLEAFHAAMQPYLSGGAYQNFPDRTQRDWQHAYYGQNFARLVEVKRAWDPENLFHYQQSIPLEV